jgi:hypothetical protein
MNNEQYPAPQFPSAPTAPFHATRDQAKPLQKLIGRMFKGKAPNRSRGKGLSANQNVAIKHNKVKFY